MGKKKILIISVSGIGNTILQSPLINRILRSDDFKADILFAISSLKDVYANDKRINNIYFIPNSSIEKISLISQLSKNKYDISLSCFPSNKIEFNILPFLIGSKKRIIHSYNASRVKTLSFLSNIKVAVDETLHDVEQNLNLLKALDIDPSSGEKKLIFPIPEDSVFYAKKFIEKNGLAGKKIIGIHAGCKKGQEEKRWPKKHFIELINMLNENGAVCLLFAGPDEATLTREILSGSRTGHHNMLITEKGLCNVAAIISYCKAFVCTDSGLGHIATTQDIPTYAITGPAMPSRTAPYGPNGHFISLGIDCSPCLKYPFKSPSAKIKCKNGLKCLKDLSPELVFSKIRPCL